MPGPFSRPPEFSPIKGIDPFGTQPLQAGFLDHDMVAGHAREMARQCDPSDRVKPAALPTRFRQNAAVVTQAIRHFRRLVDEQIAVPSAVEWLLDNAYVIEDVLYEVKEHLPWGYYKRLPRLGQGVLKGYPTVYALALDIVAHRDSSFDEEFLDAFLSAFQEARPLRLGELWAVPIMLRVALIENLRRVCDLIVAGEADADWARDFAARLAQHPRPLRAWEHELTHGRVVHLYRTLREGDAETGRVLREVEGWLTNQGLTSTELFRREHHGQAARQVTTGNIVTSLRLLSVIDWSQFVERNSLLESHLRHDPSGDYSQMDFATRDRYRRAVETLSRGSDWSEIDVARLATQRAMAGAEPESRHIGYHLVDEGRGATEALLGYKPPFRDDITNKVRRRPLLFYFGVKLAALIFFGTLLWWSAGTASPWTVLFLSAVALIPLSDLAARAVQYLLLRWVPAESLPRLDFQEGISPDCPTFIVIPTLLGSPDGARALVEKLEQHYLSHPDPALYFALLTDFPDAEMEELPGDQAALDAALEGVRELNRRYCPEDAPRFFLFHRKRQWNKAEGVWMGWERKRGKLGEFNRMMRGDKNTSYSVVSGPIDQLPHIRYVLTLDTDTVLPREAASRLIGAIAHPLNRPKMSADGRTVERGYGILQPRVSFLPQTHRKSRFAGWFAFSAGVDPYSTAASDLYQDMFGSGTFTGKGVVRPGRLRGDRRPRLPRERDIIARPDRGQLRPVRPGVGPGTVRRIPHALFGLRPPRTPLDPRRLATATLARRGSARGGRAAGK